MTIKEFFRPTKNKLVLTGLLSIITIAFFYVNILDANCNCHEWSGYRGDTPLCPPKPAYCDPSGEIRSKLTPFLLPALIPGSIIMNALSNTQFSVIGLLIQILLVILYYYIIFCIVFAIIQRFKKNPQTK